MVTEAIHGDAVIALSTVVLRIERTLDDTKIDKSIADLQALKALVAARRRRAQWGRIIKHAAAFKPER